jgi:hypothetical protein
MSERTKYTITSKGGVGEFMIRDSNGDIITVFSYKGWFSSNGSAPLKKGKIAIQSQGGWETGFTISRDKRRIGEILFNWKGNIVISLKNREGRMQRFMLKNIGGKSKWKVEDENEHEVLSMHSDTHWSKVSYQYKVLVKADLPVDIHELLIACGYGTNLNMSMIAALLI